MMDDNIDIDACVKTIPLAYWESLGYDERYGHSMNKFQADLNYCTHALKRRMDTVAIKFIPWDRKARWLGPGPDTNLFHDDLLCPLWQKFTSALCECRDDGLKCFCVAKIQLDTVIMDMLAPALKTKHLRQLRFNSNHFGEEGILFLADLLKGNSTLESLSMSNNPINELDSATQFSEALYKHPRLSKLEMDGCKVGDNIKVLSTLMSAFVALEYLKLSDNGIGPQGAEIVAQFLEANPCTKELHLNSNQLKDDGVSSVALALSKNTNLERLYLHSNEITEVGQMALFRSIFDPSSLTSVSNSNHGCELYFDGSKDINKIILEWNEFNNPKIRRKHKIVLALCGSDMDELRLRYLDDVPLELMPYVLQLLQSDQKEKSQPLKIVYEVLRCWKMPLLFGNL